MLIAGISAYYHDAACCLVENGEIVWAAEEERFSRYKHDPRFPHRSLRAGLRQIGRSLGDVECIAFYEDPARKLARQVWIHENAPESNVGRRALRAGVDAIGRLERDVRERLAYQGDLRCYAHHLSHAASAFYASGFERAALFTVDGVGEWATTVYGIGTPDGIEPLEEVDFPHSLGLFYSAITAYLGFEVNEGEYKVMGLASYGRPTYLDKMDTLLRSTDGAGYELDLTYFDFLREDRMYSDRMSDLFGHGPRRPDEEIGRFHQDLAASAQAALERILIEKATYLHARTFETNLCMAGGVALNCVANEKLRRQTPFEDLFVQPASGDSGGAVGAALLADRALTPRSGACRRLRRAQLGPSYPPQHIERLLGAAEIPSSDFAGAEDDLVERVASHISQGDVIAWFHGRMEFGPRALGARSILGDPRRADMRDRINALVKKRESFRPFAPMVLQEAAGRYFDLDHDSPFMLETCRVKADAGLPAITHVDGSARVQTVSARDHPRVAALLRAFERRTGCAVLLNTSMNARGEPIVCTPEDAIACFVRTGMDVLVLEDHVVLATDLPYRLSQRVPPAYGRDQAISHTVYSLF